MMKRFAILIAGAALAAPAYVSAQQLPPSAQERHPIPESVAPLPADYVPSSAQVLHPIPEMSVAAPISLAHWNAQVAAAPAACGGSVAQARDNISLRMQQPALGAEARASANADLQTADGFATAGDEEGCWHWYDRFQQVVR